MGPKLGTQNGFNFINEKNKHIYEYMIRCFSWFFLTKTKHLFGYFYFNILELAAKKQKCSKKLSLEKCTLWIQNRWAMWMDLSVVVAGPGRSRTNHVCVCGSRSSALSTPCSSWFWCRRLTCRPPPPSCCPRAPAATKVRSNSAEMAAH